MICKNCGNEFEGDYCNHCGQSSKVQRIDWKYLKNSIADNVFQINHGFLYTVKVLLLSLGKSLNNFFEGQRKSFYKPFAFLLISSTIFLLSTKLIGNDTFVDDFLSGVRNGASDALNQTVNYEILDFLSNNQTYVFLSFVPLFALASFISFRKNGYNFSEHLILNLYITGEQLLIYTLFSFIQDRNSIITVVPLLLGFLYNCYVYNRLFSELSWLNKNMKLLVSYVIYLTLLVMTLALLLIIILIATRILK